MKILKITIIFSFFSFFACDKVNDPYAHIEKKINEFGDEKYNDTIWSDTASNTRIILIEDFTGQLCSNCPRAADIAKDLEKKYPKQVLSVAIHNSGNFSKPDPDHGFLNNFETKTGENLRIKFNINNFPNGLINRTDINTNGIFTIDYRTWKDEVTKLVNDTNYMNSSIDIDFMSVYNSNKKTLRIFPKLTVQKDINGEVYFGVYILENGIIGPQLDGREFPALVEDYVHNHMLRVGFQQRNIGTKVFTNPKVGDFYKNDTLHTSNTILDDSWIVDSLDILTYVYNYNTNEILQVACIQINKH